MATNIEIEAKVLITEEEYERLVKSLSKNVVAEYDQINYYIESKDFDLQKKGISLRVRLLDGKYTMTLKAPLSEGLLEKNCVLTKEDFEVLLKKNIFPDNDISEFLKMLGFKVSELSIITSLKTHRIETKYGQEAYEFSVDKNEYNWIVDFELEMANDSLLKAKTQLQKICYQVGINYEDNPKSKQTRALESIKK